MAKKKERGIGLHNPTDSELLGAHVEDLKARFGSLVNNKGRPSRTYKYRYRETTGKKQIFETFEDLANAFTLYMQWADTNPQKKQEKAIIAYSLETIDVELGRAYTMYEFAQVMGLSINYFTKLESDLKDKRDSGKACADELEKLEVFNWIRTCIKAQNYSGAMVGKFNPQFTAKLHGLDSQELGSAGSTQGIQLNISVRDEQTAINLNKLHESL